MTLSEIKTLLEGIPGFAGKVTYRAFPVGQAPALPFIAFRVLNSDNFEADDEVYLPRDVVAIELYSEDKDESNENAIEAKLKALGLPWEKDESYIPEEHCNLVTYEILNEVS